MTIGSKAIAVIISMIMMIYNSFDTQEDRVAYMNDVWSRTNDNIRYELPIEFQANACGMTVEEYTYLARVIEAESDRTDSIEGKILICAVILNRVASDEFPNTIQGVLDQSGQFDTTYNGWCSTSDTGSSRWSIVVCLREMENGNIPEDLLYFNANGYFSWGTPYCYQNGNYFSLG